MKRTVAGPTETRHGGTAARPEQAGVAPGGGTKTRARAGEAPRPSWRSAARPSRSYWLVVGDGRAGPGPLVLRLDDGLRVLPVFGFEEEARLFAWRAGREVRRIEPGALLSLLRGPLRGVELVALDPLSDAPADLLDVAASLTRQRFLGSLLGAGSTARRARDLADDPAGGQRGVPEWAARDAGRR